MKFSGKCGLGIVILVFYFFLFFFVGFKPIQGHGGQCRL